MLFKFKHCYTFLWRREYVCFRHKELYCASQTYHIPQLHSFSWFGERLMLHRPYNVILNNLEIMARVNIDSLNNTRRNQLQE